MIKGIVYLPFLYCLLFFGCAPVFHAVKPPNFVVDTPPPLSLMDVIDSVSPPDSATEVPPLSLIKIIFYDTSLVIQKMSGTFCCLYTEYGEEVKCAIKSRRGIFYLIPEHPLYLATTYHVIAANLADKNKTIFPGKIGWCFTTRKK
ncbi:MAG: Ig-like domain-containing protein [Patescibacteria group bacterium]|nr:Ig-like domain-containing protein [Patescibacteria group bacterium]